ncbi:SDR family NAD(P)-dependent oxidoreductase [Hymenobacter lapidiphilus]|uniref:SDR family oxidoreductase n=1 Tax=Hymenobacter sp. CCM 8763 TaxID=2303334 RepID=UPI000E345104|nr:SDR family oxidoreductase [Hymenobacter sp. CCM 8763]RFP66616.1 SDR family NAD(P)-dependent oxidoreductase [Hymenobacter sp. CCM 8763]
MKTKLKKLSDQTIVITGASSGIGLVTARHAAKAGARLVLAARSEEALRQLTEELSQQGCEVIYVVADVSKQADVKRIAREAKQKFGSFDTWVNNAGVSMYGKVVNESIDDMRQLFETNFWGVVYGSLEATEHLRHRGGALINVGSVLSDVTAILQTMYSASKHAVKGFTDGLRTELEMEGAPISVTLIQPAAIDTPYPLNAKNYLDKVPQHAPPAYAPETVAEAILSSATSPQRNILVGGAGKLFKGMEEWTPALLDKFMEKAFAPMSKSDKADHRNRPSGLYEGAGQLQERGNYPGRTREISTYTKAKLNPAATAAIVAGTGLAVAAIINAFSKDDGNGKTPDKASKSPRRDQDEKATSTSGKSIGRASAQNSDNVEDTGKGANGFGRAPRAGSAEATPSDVSGPVADKSKQGKQSGSKS